MNNPTITFKPWTNIDNTRRDGSLQTRTDYLVFVDGEMQDHTETALTSEIRLTYQEDVIPTAFTATVNGETKRFEVQCDPHFSTPKEERLKAAEDALGSAKAYIVNTLNGPTIPESAEKAANDDTERDALVIWAENVQKLEALLAKRAELPAILANSKVYADTGVWPALKRDGSWWGAHSPAMRLEEHFSFDEMNELLTEAIEEARDQILEMVQVKVRWAEGGTYQTAREINKAGKFVISDRLANDKRQINHINQVGEETAPYLHRGAVAHLTNCLLIAANVTFPVNPFNPSKDASKITHYPHAH